MVAQQVFKPLGCSRCSSPSSLGISNQFVHKEDVLYQIEPFDFEVALPTNKAVLEQKKADLHVKVLQNEHRQKLSDLTTTAEEQQVYEGSAIRRRPPSMPLNNRSLRQRSTSGGRRFAQ